MASKMTCNPFVTLSVVVGLFLLCANGQQLQTNCYGATCPNLEVTVRAIVQQAVTSDPRNAASLIRLHFHDCFVQGCDASILLDDTPSFTGEKNAGPNAGSLRALDVIDNIKSAVEQICTATVSCADILAFAARDAVVAVQGPTWEVPCGRRDSTTASLSEANNALAGPQADLATQISLFQARGLNPQDLTVLAAAHTVGFSSCSAAQTHINGDTDVDPTFAAQLQAACASGGPLPIDSQTPNRFDKAFFDNLKSNRTLFHSDQQLNTGVTAALVDRYSTDEAAFFTDFATAMIKMSSISPLTGTAGQIRANCRAINPS